MTEEDRKKMVVSVCADGVFPFTYDVRNTPPPPAPGQVPDPGLCDINNFRPETKVAVEQCTLSFN